MTDMIDSRIVVFDYFNLRVEAVHDFNKTIIDRVTFKPDDDNIICVSGHNIWSCFRIHEGGLRDNQAFLKVEVTQFIFTEHAWLNDNQIIGCTKVGSMLIVKDNSLHKEFPNAFNSEESDSYVTCIRPFSQGFYIGSNDGDMALWLRQDVNPASTGKYPYDFIKKWQPVAAKKHTILSLSIAPKEDQLTVALSNNSIGMIPTKSTGITEQKSAEVKFDLICRGFHVGAICGLDVAVQRPIIASCSREDSTIRLWNYTTGMCELAREYFVLEDNSVRHQAKPLITVAIHPTGYQLAASFIDKI